MGCLSLATFSKLTFQWFLAFPLPPPPSWVLAPACSCYWWLTGFSTPGCHQCGDFNYKMAVMAPHDWGSWEEPVASEEPGDCGVCCLSTSDKGTESWGSIFTVPHRCWQGEGRGAPMFLSQTAWSCSGDAWFPVTNGCFQRGCWAHVAESPRGVSCEFLESSFVLQCSSAGPSPGHAAGASLLLPCRTLAGFFF